MNRSFHPDGHEKMPAPLPMRALSMSVTHTFIGLSSGNISPTPG
jgi:hypothetical protein